MDDSSQKKHPAPFRALSLEGLFCVFALFSLASGLWRGELTAVFWGAVILIGLALLILVRRRNWQEHWAAMDQQRRRDFPADQSGTRD